MLSLRRSRYLRNQIFVPWAFAPARALSRFWHFIISIGSRGPRCCCCSCAPPTSIAFVSRHPFHAIGSRAFFSRVLRPKITHRLPPAPPHFRRHQQFLPLAVFHPHLLGRFPSAETCCLLAPLPSFLRLFLWDVNQGPRGAKRARALASRLSVLSSSGPAVLSLMQQDEKRVKKCQ